LICEEIIAATGIVAHMATTPVAVSIYITVALEQL